MSERGRGFFSLDDDDEVTEPGGAGLAQPGGADHEQDPWDLLEVRAAAYFSTMSDPRDRDRLTLLVPQVGDPVEVLVFAVNGGTELFLEHEGITMHRHFGETEHLANYLVRALRGRYQLAHPELTTYRAEGPAAAGAGILRLASAETAGAEGASAGATVSRDVVLSQVLSHLRHRVGPELELDEDEDIPVMVNGVGLWVRVHGGKQGPSIILMTRVVDEIWSRRQTGVELNVLNRDHAWSRWVRIGRSVWQTAQIPARPFVPQVLDDVLTTFAKDHITTQNDLADRLGGKGSA